jgi:hypothetical protein
VALAATNLQPIANGATAIVAYTFAVTSAHAYQNGMEVVFDFGSSVGSGTNIEMTNVDCSATPYAAVGLNSNPPVFKSGQYATELLNCMRYLQIISAGNTDTFVSVGQAYSSTILLAQLYFLTPFRTSPGLTVANPTSFVITVYGSSNIVATGVSSNGAGTIACQLAVSVSGGLTQNNMYGLTATLSATLTYSARL